MGRRGPSRTPSKILQMRGSRQADNRVDEPIAPEGEPVMPDWLTEDARPFWLGLCDNLRMMKLLHVTDAGAMGRYCQLFARYARVEARIAADEEHPKAEGWHMRAGALSDKLLRLEKEFGLTPAARANLAVEKKDPNENRGKKRFFDQKGA